MFFLFNIIVALVGGFVSDFIQVVFRIDMSSMSTIYSLAILIPSIAIGVRRMHDLGRSGWWIICPFVNLVFLCLDSQPGENKYGPNPKLA